jgi:trehalose 6-phosphate phosphatase
MQIVPVDLREVAILLDVDGTLLDIAPTPESVHASASLRDTLARLQAQSGGALAFISGRPIAELDRIFAPLRMPAIGGHGAELRSAADAEAIRREAAALDPRLKRRLIEIAAAHPGIVIEDKLFSVALHYRLAPEHGESLRRAIAALRAESPPGLFEILEGKAVIEVKPPGFDKGTALRALMAHAPFAGRRPVFIGDDMTDQAAFAVLPEFNGIGISVGRDFPGTVANLPSPHDVRTWLDRISQQEEASAS